MSDDLFNLIYNKSLDLLSRREHSRKEIKDKLLLRFQSDDLIQTVLDKLETNNLINELRFAEAYTRSRKRKGFGPKKIFY
jgi:regulatory protein